MVDYIAAKSKECCCLIKVLVINNKNVNIFYNWSDIPLEHDTVGVRKSCNHLLGIILSILLLLFRT